MATPLITHRKVSGKAAGTDSTRVYGTHWDDTHVVTGLENVDNTSDANKPVSTATQAALDLKAPLASPALTGTPTAPTAAAGTNTTQIATTAGIVAERAATKTLTNTTYDTAGTGNSFKVNGTAVTAVTGTGSAVLATSPTLVTPALGTPSSVTLTNATGLPIAPGVSGLGSGIAAFLASPTSANMIAAIPTHNGTGDPVFNITPNLQTPTVGTNGATGGQITINGATSGSSVVKVAAAAGTSTFQLPVGNGTSGYVLQTDGAGVTSWIYPVHTTLSAVLGANVLLNNTASYFDGPSIAQGTTGTWLVSASVTVYDSNAAGAQFFVKLWDGTNVIASGAANPTASFQVVTMSLTGIVAGPLGNLRISVRDVSNITGTMLFNQSGSSKDGSIFAVRIA